MTPALAEAVKNINIAVVGNHNELSLEDTMSISIPLAKGFKLGTAVAGFKRSGKPDLSLAVSETPAVAAGVFTTNLFKAAPVLVGMEQLKNSNLMQAILINTGQANACTGDEGLSNCHKTISMVSEAINIASSAILPASTGVIGDQLKMDLWEKAVPSLVKNLGSASVEDMASAMMTTDAFPKYAAGVCEVNGVEVTVTGMAKGAGMICPNMATMLSLILCDAEVAPEDWQAMFERTVAKTFNRATVDGDTSTNDTVYGLANGASGAKVSGEDLEIVEAVLEDVLAELAYKLVEDGEGATKVIHIAVKGARNDADAEQAARAVGHSPLVKTAMFGKDANWGRIVAALGRAGVDFTPEDVRVTLCGVELFKNGQPTSVDFDKLLKEPLEERDIYVDILLGKGEGAYTLLASDLTHDYIAINADYRS